MNTLFLLITFFTLSLIIILLWIRNKNDEKTFKEYKIKDIYTDFMFVKSVLDENEKTHKADTAILSNLITLFDEKYPIESVDKCSMFLWHYIFEDVDAQRQLAHRMNMRGDAYKWKYDETQQMNVPVKIK